MKSSSARKNKNLLNMKQLILRMGGSYTAQNFPGTIGPLMQSTGIEDIMVETDVFLRGTANTIISGKDYYAMLRAHTLLHAAMFTLHWKAFAEWLIQEEKDIDYISVLASNLKLLLEALSKTDAAGSSSLCDDAASQLHMTVYNKACTSPTTKLWLM